MAVLSTLVCRLRNIALGFAAGAGIGAGGAYAYFRRLQPTAAPQLTPAADLLPNQGAAGVGVSAVLVVCQVACSLDLVSLALEPRRLCFFTCAVMCPAPWCCRAQAD
jgi:hypothetical protein